MFSPFISFFLSLNFIFFLLIKNSAPKFSQSIQHWSIQSISLSTIQIKPSKKNPRTQNIYKRTPKVSIIILSSQISKRKLKSEHYIRALHFSTFKRLKRRQSLQILPRFLIHNSLVLGISPSFHCQNEPIIRTRYHLRFAFNDTLKHQI